MHRIGNRRVMVARQLVIFKLSQYKSNKFIPIRDYLCIVESRKDNLYVKERGKDAQLLNVRFVSTPLFITKIADCIFGIPNIFLQLNIFQKSFYIILRNSFQFNCFVRRQTEKIQDIQWSNFILSSLSTTTKHRTRESKFYKIVQKNVFIHFVYFLESIKSMVV